MKLPRPNAGHLLMVIFCAVVFFLLVAIGKMVADTCHWAQELQQPAANDPVCRLVNKKK